MQNRAMTESGYDTDMLAKEFLEQVTRLPGLSGDESTVAKAITDAFRPYAQEVRTDALQNVCARVGAGGPRILVAAHQDEIGLIVTDIEEDGCLRIARVGGVDPRILPAAPVWVLADEGALFGVIGTKPPHMLSEAEQKKIVQFEDLFVDLGLAPAQVQKRVHIGDRVQLTGAFQPLLDNRAASKTMDDRVGVAAMLLAAQTLKRCALPVEAYFLSATQEEIGSRGVKVACFDVAPDIAIVLDVTHAEMPGSDKRDTYPTDKLTLTVGPNIHPALNRVLMDVAEANHVAYVVEPCAHVTATDAEMTQVSRAGVPSVLIGLPLRYMHTTVELIDMHLIDECARLIVLFMDTIARQWEGFAWY